MYSNSSVWVLEPAPQRSKIFAAGAAGIVSSYNTPTAVATSQCRVSNGWVNGLAYLKSVNALVASTSRGSLLALCGDTLAVTNSVTASYWFNAVKAIPGTNSHRCVVTTAEGLVLLWNARSGEFSEFPRRHTDQVWSCSVSEDGALVATCGGNGELGLWNVAEAEFVSWIGRGGYTITSVAFLCKRRLLVSVDMGGLLTVWGLDDQHPVSRVVAHEARIWSIAASADQQLLVTAGADRRVAVWDVSTLRLVHEVRLGNIPTACSFVSNSTVAV